MLTMSAGKVFILLAYAERVADGLLDPGQKVVLRADALLPGTGALRYCRPGLALTLADLAYLMITYSDNVATNLLLEALGGPVAVNTSLDRLKLSAARLVSPLFQGEFAIATPRSLAEAYTVLEDPLGVGYNPTAAELCRNVLQYHQDTNGLARYLPWSPYAKDFNMPTPVEVFAKSGQFPGAYAEAGLFVTHHSRYVVAIMCADLPDPQINAAGLGATLLADIGRILYDAWQ
jgi:beta-lactamase class A